MEKDFNKLVSKKTVHHSEKTSTSMFDKVDSTVIEPKEKLSEFEKAYMGKPSKFENMDLKEEYHKALLDKSIKKRKPAKQKARLVKQKDQRNDAGKVIIGETIIEEEVTFGKYPSAPPPQLSELLKVLPDGNNQDQIEEETQEAPEKIDRALEIAEDFVRRWNIITVGDAAYIHNGRFYSLLSEKEVRRLILKNYRSEVGRASTAALLRNVTYLISVCTNKIYEEFPVNSHLIVFANGTLEIKTGQFRNNSPNDLASSALGINYDPNRWKMPATQGFLETIAAADDDLYELMLQVIGYILSNDIKAKSFFYLEGVGDAGKSRFCDLIASFFPTSGANKVARIALQDLGGKFALGNLVNAKLNISEDLPDSPLTPATVSRIKMISDSNRLEAEAKYVQAFSFKPQCKLLFASNHPLRLKDYDAAFENRVVYLPFLHAIPKHRQDPMILEKMQRELPALFNHAFAAYKRLVANGYQWAGADRFKPEICVVNSGISFDKENILRRFVVDCCILEEDAITPTADLQYSYQRFCNENHYLPIMGDRFSRELKNVLPDTVTRVKIGNQQRGFKGIKLKDI